MITETYYPIWGKNNFKLSIAYSFPSAFYHSVIRDPKIYMRHFIFVILKFINNLSIIFIFKTNLASIYCCDFVFTNSAFLFLSWGWRLSLPNPLHSSGWKWETPLQGSRFEWTSIPLTHTAEEEAGRGARLVKVGSSGSWTPSWPGGRAEEGLSGQVYGSLVGPSPPEIPQSFSRRGLSAWRVASRPLTFTVARQRGWRQPERTPTVSITGLSRYVWRTRTAPQRRKGLFVVLLGYIRTSAFDPPPPSRLCVSFEKLQTFFGCCWAGDTTFWNSLLLLLFFFFFN